MRSCDIPIYGFLEDMGLQAQEMRAIILAAIKFWVVNFVQLEPASNGPLPLGIVSVPQGSCFPLAPIGPSHAPCDISLRLFPLKSIL